MCPATSDCNTWTASCWGEEDCPTAAAAQSAQRTCLETKHLAAHGKAVLGARVDLQAAEQGQTESLAHPTKALSCARGPTCQAPLMSPTTMMQQQHLLQHMCSGPFPCWPKLFASAGLQPTSCCGTPVSCMHSASQQAFSCCRTLTFSSHPGFLEATCRQSVCLASSFAPHCLRCLTAARSRTHISHRRHNSHAGCAS